MKLTASYQTMWWTMDWTLNITLTEKATARSVGPLRHQSSLSMGQADQGSVCSDADVEPVSCGEEKTELEGKALNLPDDLHYDPHLWS